MKIQNTSSTPIPISFMRSDGETVSISLAKGEFVYTNSPIKTKSIIIQGKKGNIQTTEDAIPDNLEYYKIYSKDVQGSENLTSRPLKSVKEEKDAIDQYKGQFKIPMNLPPRKPPIKEVETVQPTNKPEPEPKLEPKPEPKPEPKLEPKPEVQPEIKSVVEKNIKAEEPKKKNKGGRPKGSKDTVKRGEPKLKKPPGRPINTEAMKGMKVEDVKSKCDSRGYTIRITNEDGNAHIVTADLRFDRVNLQIENGIVIKANIG